jgi:hypothetical protein
MPDNASSLVVDAARMDGRNGNSDGRFI